MAGVWLVLLAPQLCWGHGKLTAPTPRDGISTGRAGLDENNPVSFEPGCDGPMNRCDAFVCREASRNPLVDITKVTAGSTLQLQWSFTAFHVGDCSAYVSYDVDLPRSQQKFVKIANLPDCKSYPGKEITIPAGLPAGRAILRWDWAALHIWPTVEFYVQCADIEISSSSGATAADLDSYSITSPPVYPDNGNDGVGYRNAFNTGMVQAMTGPSCFDGSINDCSLTAPGTLRNTDSLRETAPTPAPSTTAAPASTQQPPTSTVSSTPAPTTTSVASSEFSEVDGGNDRACRGANINDNDASHYTVTGGMSSLEACKNTCINTAGCVGIEYNSGSLRCEVWTRSDGIGASVMVSGYQCLRYTAALGTTTVPSSTPNAISCVPLGDCSAWCIQTEYAAYCSGQGTAGSCPAPWCMTSASTSAPVTRSPAPVTTTPTSTIAVSTTSTAGGCVASLTGLYTDASIWEPWCATAWTASSCPSPMCRQTPSLLAKSRKHSFLGTALLQAGTEMDLAMGHEL